MFVGGLANGDLRSSDLPTLDVRSLSRPIDYLLATDESVATVTNSYQAQRVSFGGRVFRTWMLHGADPIEHATAAVLLFVFSDPARVRQIVEDE